VRDGLQRCGVLGRVLSFGAHADWPVAGQIVALGLVHVASCAVIYTGVGTGARVVLRARPTAARAVTRISGVAMVAIGVFLLVEQLIH
jgi:threonine/homoserine/homoserine lactone efflux protein